MRRRRRKRDRHAGQRLDRAAVVVSGDRVVVVQSRYGGDVPGFSATYRFTSTDRGVSFGPGEVVGNVTFYETVAGPGDTLSGVPSASSLGMAFQNVLLSGASPVAMNGTSTVPRALLSATHVYYSSVGLIDAGTPLAVFATAASQAQHRRYDGSGSLNDAANWTAPVDIGYADYAKLAGGPSGLFLLAGAARRQPVRAQVQRRRLRRAGDDRDGQRRHPAPVPGCGRPPARRRGARRRRRPAPHPRRLGRRHDVAVGEARHHDLRERRLRRPSRGHGGRSHRIRRLARRGLRGPRGRPRPRGADRSPAPAPAGGTAGPGPDRARHDAVRQPSRRSWRGPSTSPLPVPSRRAARR